LHYADLADLVVDAPIIVRTKVKKAIKIDPERVSNAPAGTQRFYVEGITEALIRGQGGIPESIRYVIDLPLDDRGRAPKIRKKTLILFARSPRSYGELQLVAPDAQISWTPEREQRIRTIVREAVRRDAPPPISKIASVFHVPGTIIGEGETQIFMETADSAPVSITILSREDQRKVWAVSLGEIVDEAARAPQRNTLLWYRLACFLPRELPYAAFGGDVSENARKARADYQLVLKDLGSCPRSRRSTKPRL
ncbi:FIG00636170: hypothetical protein, partial [hydrothermal vent metagenome]